MKKILIAIAIFIFSIIKVFSQADKLDSLLNDLIFNDTVYDYLSRSVVKYDFIYSGIGFKSNTFYAGRDYGSDIYNTSGYIYYYHNKGIYLGASGMMYEGLTPFLNTVALSAGFYKTIDKNKLFTFKISYNRYFYFQTDTSIEYSFKNNTNLGLSFKKNWFGARIYTGLSFGKESRFNVSSVLYSRINVIKLGKYNRIYTMPEISAYFGSETIETLNESQMINIKDVYGLLNTQFYLPLTISVGNFEIELAYTINFPVSQDDNVTYPVSSLFSASVGYLLPIKR